MKGEKRRKKVAAPDPESRLHDAHHESLRLWLRLLTCTLTIERRVRAQLRERFAITLPRFDLLAQLERNPAGLKMGELSRRLMVTSGSITGLTDQLAAEGLVERTPIPADRRAFLVRLTAKGKRTFDVMAAAHEGWIVDMFSGLKEGERARIACAARPAQDHAAQQSTRQSAERKHAHDHGCAVAAVCRISRHAFPVGRRCRRQGRDDHARPAGAQESAHVRFLRRTARPVSRARLRERREVRRRERRRRQLQLGRRRARDHRTADEDGGAGLARVHAHDRRPGAGDARAARNPSSPPSTGRARAPAR